MAWQTFANSPDGVFVNVRGIFNFDALDQTTPNIGAGNGYFNNFWEELDPVESVNKGFGSFYNTTFNGNPPFSYNNTPPTGATITPTALSGIDKIVGSSFNDYIQTGANDDIILGGAGKDFISSDDGANTKSNDIVEGGSGDDFIGLGGDTGSVSVTSDPISNTLGRTTPYTNNNTGLNAFKQEWVTDAQNQGIQLFGTAFDGFVTDYLSPSAINNLTLDKTSYLTYGSVNGIGVPSSYAGWYNNGQKDRAEINHDPNTGLSQTLTFKWATDKTVQSADIDLSSLSRRSEEVGLDNIGGDEVGFVQAFKDGVEVDITGVRLNSNGTAAATNQSSIDDDSSFGVKFTADSANGDYKLRLTGDFDELRFTAQAYANPNSGYQQQTFKTDSSDYLVQQIKYSATDLNASSVTPGDAVTGGSGADTFSFNKGSGVDSIADFNSLQGDKVLVRGYTATDLILDGTTALFKNGSSYEAIASNGTSNYSDINGNPVTLTGNSHIWQLSDFVFV